MRTQRDTTPLAVSVRCVEIAALLLMMYSFDVRAVASDANILDVGLEDFHAEDGWEFRTLCEKVLKKPCGIEQGPNDSIMQSKGLRPLHLSKTTPRKVLDAIATRNPSHQWVSRDGVINLEPKKRGEDLLARRLDKVSIHGVSSFQAARIVLDQAKIPFTYQIKGGRYALIDLELNEVTVRDALNAIVRADGQIMWTFTYAPKASRLRAKGTLIMPSWRNEGIGPHGEVSTNEKKR